MSEPEAATVAVDSTGDLAIPFALKTGRAAVAQRLDHRFKFFFGEWFLDQRQGVPYYQNILVKNPNLKVVRGIFRQVILKTPGIFSIKKFELTLDRKTREISIDFEAVMTGGEILRSQPQEFIVTYPV